MVGRGPQAHRDRAEALPHCGCTIRSQLRLSSSAPRKRTSAGARRRFAKRSQFGLQKVLRVSPGRGARCAGIPSPPNQGTTIFGFKRSGAAQAAKPRPQREPAQKVLSRSPILGRPEYLDLGIADEFAVLARDACRTLKGLRRNSENGSDPPWPGHGIGIMPRSSPTARS